MPASRSSISSGTTWPSRTARCAAFATGRWCSSASSTARRASLLPEARAEAVPEFVRTVELSFPSGRTADEVVVDNAAALAWVVNLGCIDLNPHPVRVRRPRPPGRAARRPRPRCPACRGRTCEPSRSSSARCSRSWATPPGPRPRARAASTSTSASSRAGPSATCGARRWRSAREVERRAPEIATSKWWKEERHGVFLDYNQNAKDRTVASVYSVRPRPERRVSVPR